MGGRLRFGMAIAGLVALAATGAAACGRPKAEPVTPEDAQEIVVKWFAARAQAWSSLDERALGRYDTSTALESDLRAVREARSQGETSLDADPPPDTIKTFVAHERSPREFGAHLQWRGASPWPRVLLFVRSDTPGDRWKVSANVVVPPDYSDVTMFTDDAGYGRRLTDRDDASLAVDPDLVPAEMAQFLDQDGDQASAGSKYFPMETQTQDLRATLRMAIANKKADGIVLRISHTGGRPLAVYRTDGGGALVIFPLKEERRYHAPGGSLEVSESADSSAAGKYWTVFENTTLVMAVHVPPAGQPPTIDSVGYQIGSPHLTGYN